MKGKKIKGWKDDVHIVSAIPYSLTPIPYIVHPHHTADRQGDGRLLEGGNFWGESEYTAFPTSQLLLYYCNLYLFLLLIYDLKKNEDN